MFSFLVLFRAPLTFKPLSQTSFPRSPLFYQLLLSPAAPLIFCIRSQILFFYRNVTNRHTPKIRKFTFFDIISLHVKFKKKDSLAAHLPAPVGRTLIGKFAYDCCADGGPP